MADRVMTLEYQGDDGALFAWHLLRGLDDFTVTVELGTGERVNGVLASAEGLPRVFSDDGPFTFDPRETRVKAIIVH
jgi:hypothetical protein